MIDRKKKSPRKKIEMKYTLFFYYAGLMLIFVGGIIAGTYVASTEKNKTNAPIIDVNKINTSESDDSDANTSLSTDSLPSNAPKAIHAIHAMDIVNADESE